MTAELLVAEQIARLFYEPRSVVWELVDAPARAHAGDVTIRSVDGLPVIYARRGE